MGLTPEDIRNKRFTAVRFKEGYDLDEVDSFLDEIEDTLTELSKSHADLAATAKGEVPTSIRESLERFESENSELKSTVERLQSEVAREQERANELANAAASSEGADQGVVDQLNSQVAQLRDELNAANEEKTALAAQLEELKNAPAAAAATPEPGDVSTASVRILELAQRTADEHVATARIEAEDLRNKSRFESEALLSEAKTNVANITREFESQRAGLERKIEELRAYEREYRSRLRSYLEGQLRELESKNLAGGEITSDQEQ